MRDEKQRNLYTGAVLCFLLLIDHEYVLYIPPVATCALYKFIYIMTISVKSQVNQKTKKNLELHIWDNLIRKFTIYDSFN